MNKRKNHFTDPNGHGASKRLTAPRPACGSTLSHRSSWMANEHMSLLKEALRKLRHTEKDFQEAIEALAIEELSLAFLLERRGKIWPREPPQIQWPPWMTSDSDKDSNWAASRIETVEVYGAILASVPTILPMPDLLETHQATVLAVLSKHWPVQNAVLAPPSPTKKPSASRWEARYAEAAFDYEEVPGTTGNLASTTLLGTLLSYSSDYRTALKSYHSPYTSLVGPSGIGKSFAVKQLAVSHNVYVIYSSLASSKSTAVPGGSPIRDHLVSLTTPSSARRFWRRYIQLGNELVETAQEYSIGPGLLFRLQHYPDFHWARVRLAALLNESYWVDDDLRYDQESDDEEENSIAGTYSAKHSAAKSQTRDSQEQTKTRRKYELRAILNDFTADLPNKGSFLRETLQTLRVFCIDEARALLYPKGIETTETMEPFKDKVILFRAFRHALRQVRERDAKNNQLFGLLLDTSSRVSNFTPAAVHDPSAKQKQAYRLFQPIYQISTWDIVFANTCAVRSWLVRCLTGNIANASAGGAFTTMAAEFPVVYVDPDTETMQWQRFLYTLGRPLWGAVHKAVLAELNTYNDTTGSRDERHDSVSVANLEVLRLAATKLHRSNRDDADFLALLSFRMAFRVEEHKLAETLVARWLHHLVYVSDDRRVLRATQPSEPVLACAASRIMNDLEVRDNVVKAFVNYFTKGALNIRDMGEMVAAMLFLFSADVHLASNTPKTIPLQDLLATLVSPLPAGWADGQVYLTHFSRLCCEETLSPRHLQMAFLTGQGWFLEKNCPGADILIPVRNCLTGRISALLVQVKNKTGHRRITSRLCKMAEDDIYSAKRHIPFLHNDDVYGLYMSLRPVVDKKRTIGGKSEEVENADGADDASDANDAEDGEHDSSTNNCPYVRWRDLDTRRGIKIGITVGFNKSLFPILRGNEGSKDFSATIRIFNNIEVSLSTLLGWSDTGFVHKKDIHVRKLLWTRDTSTLFTAERANASATLGERD